MCIFYYYIVANSRLRRDFPHPQWAQRPRRHLWATATFGGGERNKIIEYKFGAPWVPHIWGARGAPVGASANATFGGDKKNKREFGAPSAPPISDVTRSMRIPNVCLVLKLDNGKVVCIANRQTHRVTQPSSTVLVYRVYCVVFIKH